MRGRAHDIILERCYDNVLRSAVENAVINAITVVNIGLLKEVKYLL